MPAFDMETGIVYTRNELLARAKACPRYGAILVDEGVNLLFNRDAMQKEQKQLLRFLDICRKRNLTVYWCIPRFFAVDSHFRNSRCLMWIYVWDRGWANVYTPLKGEKFAYVVDPWQVKLNQHDYLGYKHANSPNFKGVLRFNDLDPQTKAAYLEICRRKSADSETKD
jgi:hypothetical protein